MAIDFEKEQEEILAEDRHQEVLQIFKTLMDVLSEKNDDATVSALQKHTEAIKLISASIKSLPEPKVTINNNELASSIREWKKEMTEKMDELITEMKNRPIVSEFKLEEDSFSHSRSVKVIYKATKDISVKAGKYGVN